MTISPIEVLQVGTCTKCKTTKLAKDFYVQSSRPCGILTQCKVCRDSWFARRMKDPVFAARRKGSTTFYERLRKYGVSRRDYDTRLAAQGGVCQTCGVPPKENKSLCVDHCHRTGKVRGLLCDACNTALGFAKDSTSILLNLVEYLKCHS
jgi:hypothetical protein